ncbi:Calmodulin-sensitive adenylate cyclase precursor [Providencia rettgeri]|uniref:anthrax toxin-like adenylyl cyclase domain-containing protein n=1 Tax=Providencia rettgeri TaxID=587 RepID=UPI001EF46A51|nr:anthrax toxin-like adenylyl cyclase domain-containing protein [Providencia rettgeri]CAB5559420.1 Calmodulin-sensitive adenylate cyclase precursor [Providencia rettgeri]CAC9151151.1 Calmodulin-sensitive adenylate cyclase precursor [Providencia rettgeri]
MNDQDVKVTTQGNNKAGRGYSSINLQLKPLAEPVSQVKTGIPVSHQRIFTKIATEENIIIGIRPVDIKSTSLIESGMYSSKGLAVKGKSADWGPHSGFIPIQQQFAKKSGRDNSSQFNDQIQGLLGTGKVISVHLEISTERIDELLRFRAISPLEPIDNGGYQRITSIVNGNEKVFFLRKNENSASNSWKVYHQDSGKFTEFLVVGDSKTGKPITADYDLFSIIFPISDLEHYIKVSEMPSWEEWKKSVNYDELSLKQKKLFNNKAEYDRYEGQDNGVINKKIKQIKNNINRQLGRENGFELVHHGADDANPASVMSENFPITFFLPENLKGKNKLKGSTESIETYFPMNSNGSIIIDNVEQLSNFQQLLINQGYRAPLNKKWSEGDNGELFEPKRKISESYLRGVTEISRKKSLNDNAENNQQANDIDDEFKDIHLDDDNKCKPILAGEHSSEIENIDIWERPLLEYSFEKALETKKKQQSSTDSERSNKYTYNVIVQLEGDSVTAGAAANAFSKHPSDTMVIQYSLTTRKYHVLHGDVTRAQSGKVRWITVGHGDYFGANNPTVYAYKSASEYTEGLNYLKQKVFNNHNPDKLVMLGCELSRGGINENFALKAVVLLGESHTNVPVVAYKREINVANNGQKRIYPTGKYGDSVTTEGYKMIYTYHSETGQVEINNRFAALHFINELRRGELTFAQLIQSSKIDPLRMFRGIDSRVFDINLLKQVCYNPDAYRLFNEELKKSNGVLPADFHTKFSKKLCEMKITDVPFWEMVDAKRILKTPTSRQPTSSEQVVVIRLSEGESGLHLAEKIATRDPLGTVIFQMDVDRKKYILEYGSLDLATSAQRQHKVSWLLIGDDGVIQQSATRLAAELSVLRKKYPQIDAQNIIFHLTDPSMKETGSRHRQFIYELSSNLKTRGIPLTVKSNFNDETQGHLLEPHNKKRKETVLSKKSRHAIIDILEKIALKEISIQDINKTDHAYLLTYFSDENGNIDVKKLNIAVSDPLINRKLNEFLSHNAETNTLSLELLLEPTISSSHQQQAGDIQTLLTAIKNDISILNHLSGRSQKILMKLFPAGDGIDKGKILALVTDNHEFISFSNRLNDFSKLSTANFTGDNAPLKKYSFADAFSIYEQNQVQRLTQFNQQLMYGNKVELVNHGVIRFGSQSREMDQTLGGTYAVEFYLAGGHLARDFIERKGQIEQATVKNASTSAENSLLIKMEQYSQDINTVLHKNGISVADQSLGSLFTTFSEVNNAIIFLKGKSVTYTVTYVQRNGGYKISLFDPHGLQFSVKNSSPQQAQQQFQQQIKHYFSENNQLSEGEFRADFQLIDLDSAGFKSALSSLRSQRQSIIEQPEFTLPKNCWVTINGEKIAFAKLQQLGATIDGKMISLSDINSPDLHHKIRFSPDKLAMYFTLMEGGKEDLSFIKVFHEQLKSADIHQLIERQANFTESGVLRKQFKYLANSIDIQQDAISSSVLFKVRQEGKRLSQLRRLANRSGQIMGTAGAIQSLISAYAILDKLDNPDISDEEIKELEKQFYLLAASALFNYGDMIVQPMLLNIASSKGATSLVRATIASGTVVIFNLVGMGIDVYQAYDSLSKLDNVTDPKQRQDLIVNASFSIANAVINGVTVIGILVGSSVIPVAGLVIGGILLVGGWAYSGVRAVQNIKEVIDIDWDRELEEGIRGALGLDPTIRSQQEMNVQHYINAFKEQDWHMDLALFENNILQAGFAHHLSIIEKPTYENESRYYLVDNYDNYFYGKLGNLYLGAGNTTVRFLRKGAPSFTADEVKFILQNKIVRTTAWFKNLKHLYEKIGWSIHHDFHLQAKEKEIFDLRNTGSIATHERYSLNSTYKNSLLDEFKLRHQILDDELSQPLQDQLINSNPEQISFYSKKTEFGVLGQQMLRENERVFSEHLVNNRQRTALYIENTNSEGTSWNTANGNDVVIGKKSQKNAFQVLSGEKYFAGGDKDDLFFIRDSCLASLTSLGGKKPTKYLDGQDGQDTIIIDNLPDSHRVYVNLNKNTVLYQRERNHSFIPVAHLQSMENVMIRGNSNDHLRGNDTANILDGGLGKDIVEGKGGDDKLILTQGIAAGGDGNDSYHIRRYEWLDHADDLYLTERYFDRKEKSVKTRKYLNPIYIQNNHKFQAKVVIKESNYQQSRVALEYFLDEIKQVQLDGNHLVLTIRQPKNSIDGHFFQNVESEVNIVLENIQDADSKVPHHVYRLQTLDGWMITTVIDEKYPNKYFSLSYIQEGDQLSSIDGKSVKIDESMGTITINQSRHYKEPNWGWFTPIGRAEHLTYRGNSQNNILPLIKLGSYIEVSHGIDTYQIVQNKEEYGEVEFDFSKVNDSFTDKDSLCLLLSTENGYSLYMDDGQLYRLDKFGQKQLTIKFTNVGNKLCDVVLIQDKHSNLFKVNLQENRLTPVNPVKESSAGDDQIILSMGYQSEKHVIDAQNGDDTIINKGLESYVLLGGDGDDNIKASGGNNLLYGGAGDNFISGGSGDDLLLSSLGNDTLMGEAGDDHYLIDGHQAGVVYIEDQIGNNHIHLVNFKRQPIEESDSIYQFYASPAGKLVKIKASNDDGEGNFNIHHYERLDEKFNSSTRHGMTPLVNYLSEKLHKAKQSGAFTTWKPVDELASTLNGVVVDGVARPLKLTLRDDGILLQQDCTRNNWLIDTLGGNDHVMDMSKQGRIIKGGSGHDKLITQGGENVLYGGQGDDILLAQGMHQDVLISLDGKDQLAGTQGDDLYIVSGHGKGDVKITDVEGRNQVVLIDLEETNYKQLSTKIAETTYRSKSGREVTLIHNNHIGSKNHVMQVRHLNSYQQLSEQHIEKTIDRLVQLLVEERIDYERNLDLSIPNDNYRKNWGAVQITERFLSHLK